MPFWVVYICNNGVSIKEVGHETKSICDTECCERPTSNIVL